MTELQDKANDAFYAWEIANNEQDLSDRDRMIWTAGWINAQIENLTDENLEIEIDDISHINEGEQND